MVEISPLLCESVTSSSVLVPVQCPLAAILTSVITPVPVNPEPKTLSALSARSALSSSCGGPNILSVFNIFPPEVILGISVGAPALAFPTPTNIDTIDACSIRVPIRNIFSHLNFFVFHSVIYFLYLINLIILCQSANVCE